GVRRAWWDGNASWIPRSWCLAKGHIEEEAATSGPARAFELRAHAVPFRDGLLLKLELAPLQQGGRDRRGQDRVGLRVAFRARHARLGLTLGLGDAFGRLRPRSAHLVLGPDGVLDGLDLRLDRAGDRIGRARWPDEAELLDRHAYRLHVILHAP